MKHYTVIGGGLAGLTAANALASNAHKVTLFEKSEHLGGRAITQDDRGFLLNLGPHALYAGGLALKTFEEWKIPISGKRPVLGAAAYLVYQGRKYPFIGDTRTLLRTPMLGLAEKFEAARLLYGLTSSQARPGESMHDWLGRHTRSPRVRDFAAAITRVSTYTAELQRLSADAALAQIRSGVTDGVLYLDGGWQTLVDGLTERALSLGVEIRRGRPIAHLDSRNTAGVVLAVPPAAAEQISGVHLPKLRPVRLACLDLGLRHMPTGAASFALGVDRPLYLSVHSNTAKLAPPGAALVHAGKYLGAENGDATADRAELERFADLTLPGWRGQVEVVRFLPNMTAAYAVASPQGRPDDDALGIPGVTLAGDWVGAQGMLADAAVASGLQAAAVLQRGKRQAA